MTLVSFVSLATLRRYVQRHKIPTMNYFLRKEISFIPLTYEVLQIK